MAGNSQRKGAIKKTGKGNPTAGSGGRVRRGLEGKGPTPKAKDRPYHAAHKAAKRAEKAQGQRPRKKTNDSDLQDQPDQLQRVRAFDLNGDGVRMLHDRSETHLTTRA